MPISPARGEAQVLDSRILRGALSSQLFVVLLASCQSVVTCLSQTILLLCICHQNKIAELTYHCYYLHTSSILYLHNLVRVRRCTHKFPARDDFSSEAVERRAKHSRAGHQRPRLIPRWFVFVQAESRRKPNIALAATAFSTVSRISRGPGAKCLFPAVT